MESETDLTLSLPRILCLHGGGTNGSIFQEQSRGLIRALRSRFRLVFADGPFVCDPHPDIIETYGGYGPFRRWLRWQSSDRHVDSETVIRLIRRQITSAMVADDLLGGMGEWVGLLGFSQGANIAASLLWTQQAMSTRPVSAPTRWRFGVILAGRPPLVALDDGIALPPGINHAGAASSEFRDWPNESTQGHVLDIPTLHVHGTADPGLEQHRRLLDVYCNASTACVVEWDGAHRVPLKKSDVNRIVHKMIELTKEVNIIC
ncbi:citrinin biosynthesis oxidoreductase CtnB [Colletotrichum truncatum]|uniref:Citrinin biosynthesis oxidoreductase CtnB n=1 Tax=Colletotrichum truncatum TaxID=5467 RepID=A0ACC3Z2T5_COLTU|nr:citrinin biosynthesis oxidoreductase CtnB [Colletotrichum truncatum]KAF6793284.1 citrinin biosynthesis oxidoreductase CtnB [Colletotrichum truncatum]